ncbi:hypothetical protein [Mucilaginibacter ginsenosidivorax]|uniref:Uncharacterized protein n=1 Tax=Mucilaginibacter ginsenosidivorax TaxID=862126 RepID=A0A5B8W3T8_9SPHI|nr:hypothetical protein [Mucilaginibacter ginsenosidivorax]QEC78730.1 hypothetical protein FSB76_23300 [Mucilaginibacter ginsenosidivorax]
MKNSIKMLIAFVVISLQISTLYAYDKTNNTGVYLTEQDYKAGKLSYILSNGDSMHLNDFLGGNHISIRYQGKKIKLSKKQVFGYRQDNQDFRFYQNQAYRVLDTAGFLLYTRDGLEQQGKGPKAVAKYFYSVNTQEPVLNLTLQNVIQSFPADSDFCYSVQNNFHQDADLMIFDRVNRQYEIKHLYLGHKHNLNNQHAAI